MVTQLRPTNLAEVSEAMRSGQRLLIAGAGTAAEWGGTPAEVDAILDTTGLDGILSYQPADMTVAVRAGMPLADLQQALAEHGQRIALDAARIPLGATVGGLIATADGGPARHAYGTLRDMVIGITVVLADGTVARSGGYVIKNVAGYDLAKLFHGSLGTLGVIAEAVLRVYPIPKQTRTVAVECTPAEGFELAGQLMAKSLEPTALEWFGGRLLARFEGTQAGVARRSAGFEEVDPAVWSEVARVAVGEPGDTVFRVGLLPSRSAWFADRLKKLAGDLAHEPAGDLANQPAGDATNQPAGDAAKQPAGDAGNRPAGEPAGDRAELSSSLGVGVHTVRLPGPDPAAHAGVLTELRDEVSAAGGSTTVLRRAADVPAWGSPPPAVALMRAVKQRFDPDNRLGAGRFAPWF
jgi:glycolate oxidase FAD binding subunit